MEDTGVLIVGAGPTGLVLALWLTRLVCAPHAARFGIWEHWFRPKL